MLTGVFAKTLRPSFSDAIVGLMIESAAHGRDVDE